jgi:hypothetical protein
MDDMDLENRIHLERRITRLEENMVSLREDISEIKKSVRWLIGIVFSLNTTIIGLLAKGLMSS